MTCVKQRREGQIFLGLSFVVQFSGQPSPRVRPIAFDGGNRPSEYLGDLFYAEAGEESQAEDLGLAGIELFELFDGRVQIENVDRCAFWRGEITERLSVPPTAVFQTTDATGAFDQDPAHGFGGSTEEVPAAIPRRVVVADEPQKDLVHKSRRLERVPGRLACHACLGHATEFIVDEGQQRFGGERIAGFERLQNLRYL